MVGHFSEPDDVWSRGWSVTCRTVFSDLHFEWRVPSVIAGGTKRTGQLTMHMNRACTRLFVEPIDILRDQNHLSGKAGLQVRQCDMRRVWFRLCRLYAARIVKTMYQIGIAGKGLGCGDVFDSMLRPKPAFIPKCAQSTFCRYSGTSQYHDPVDPLHRVPFHKQAQPGKSLL
jgi:hypothetical protein